MSPGKEYPFQAMVGLHLVLLHENGSGNPLGVDTKSESISFLILFKSNSPDSFIKDINFSNVNFTIVCF